MGIGRLAILILAATLLAGCGAVAAGQASPRDALVIGCDEFSAPRDETPAPMVERTMNVAIGETFAISLCSNASTGFAWEEPVVGSPAIVSLVDRQSAAPATSLVGAAGSETLTFRVATAGTTTVGLAYSQPWAGGLKRVWTVQIAVTGS